jgi:hypothetical protein
MELSSRGRPAQRFRASVHIGSFSMIAKLHEISLPIKLGLDLVHIVYRCGRVGGAISVLSTAMKEITEPLSQRHSVQGGQLRN